MTNCENKPKCKCIIKAVVLLLILATSVTSAIFSFKAYKAVSTLSVKGQHAPALNPKDTITRKYAKNKTFEKAQKSGKPAIVLFYVDWCGFCQRFAPTFNELIKSKEFKSKFSAAYVNCEDAKNQQLVGEYEVNAYPTVYLVDFKSNKKVQVENPILFQPDAINNLLKKLNEFNESNDEE